MSTMTGEVPVKIKPKTPPLRVGRYKPRQENRLLAGELIETNGARIKLSDGRKLWAAQLPDGSVIGVHKDEIEALRGKDLLRATLKYIEELEQFRRRSEAEGSPRRELWRQGVWRMPRNEATVYGFVPDKAEVNGTTIVRERCGTPMCFAGWGATLAGCTWPDGSSAFVNSIIEPGEQRPANAEAMELMGIDKRDARVLFHAENDIGQLREYVRRLLQGVRISSF